MVSRRMCTARSICRSDHPRRPKAITCCLFSSFKTLLTSTEGIALASDSTSRVPGLLAGFQVIMYGRFSVITEGERTELIGSEEAVSMGRCAKTMTKGQKAFETEIADFATHIPRKLFRFDAHDRQALIDGISGRAAVRARAEPRDRRRRICSVFREVPE